MNVTLYQGTGLVEKVKDLNLDPYMPGDKLVKAVQLAQILGRPLLLKGEPGCGKTRVAQAVAYELFGKDYKKCYFEWNVKSNSKAQDGLYSINYLQRLRDANLPPDPDPKKNKTRLDIVMKKDPDGDYKAEGQYITLGELGKAFQLSNKLAKIGSPPPVVLIDEIDKADIDFPNDLLLEMDKMQFKIPEAKDEDENEVVIEANKDLRPLIFITSNEEKILPPAFLRRCLFHFIDFEDIRSKLPSIIKRNYPDLPDEFITSSIAEFTTWRDVIEKKGTSMKNISTSELLDWVKIIDHYRSSNSGITFSKGDNLIDWIKKIDQYYVASSDGQLPPYSAALLKDIDSIKNFAEPTTA
jgi:MoxR-like ATPase